jgi:redox-sensitive bicupin YhaK (pirin superfamily)
MHGIQSWVALPREEEETAPEFSHHEGGDLPVHRDRGSGCDCWRARRSAYAAVRTHSPLFYLHVVLEPRAHRCRPNIRARGLSVSSAVEADGRAIAAQMAVFAGSAEP